MKSFLVRTTAIIVTLAAVSLLVTWLIIRIIMGLTAQVTLPWQVFHFTVAALLIVPAALLVFLAAGPFRPGRKPWSSGSYLMAAGGSVLWLLVAGTLSAASGL